MKSLYIGVDGCNTHYLTAGDGPPLVLVHGGGMDNATLSWGESIPVFAQTHRVIAPDLPGSGQSDKGHREYTMEFYVDFLRRFLDALGVDRASLAGISLGGSISLGFALSSPDRVDRLVLVDSYGLSSWFPMRPVSWLVIRVPGLNRCVSWMTRRSKAMTKAALCRFVFADPSRVTPQLVDEVYQETGDSGSGLAFQTFQRSEVRWWGLRSSYRGRLGELRCPVLLVNGAGDKLVPARFAEAAHRQIPGSELVIIPNCGHWPMKERPDVFRDAVLRFLEGRR